MGHNIKKGVVRLMATVSGYSGLYRQPYANSATYGDTIYLVTDALHQELNLIILTPGCYRDAYRIASSMTYQRVNLFIPSVDALFISDVFRLVTDLLKIKKSVKWYYPEKIKVSPSNVLFEAAEMRGNLYVSPTISNFNVEFKLSSELDPNHRFYDFFVTEDKLCSAFCMYMDDAKLKKLVSEFDEIHVPYNCTFYGGLTCRECADLYPSISQKLVANNFKCKEEFIEASQRRLGLARRVIA